MEEFTMEVAGHTACVRALFESTPYYFRDYLTDAPGEFTVTVTPRALEFEQAALFQEALRDGFRPRRFSDYFLERAAVQRGFAEYLFAHDIFLLHGSAVAADGKCYLFTAKSGTGKSTHVRLWCQLLGQRAVIVNDDRPFVALTAEGVTVYGAPWSGKHGLDANISAPLAGICLLERAGENSICPAQPEAVLEQLLGQCYQPLDEALAPLLESRLRSLTARVPLWQLSCNKSIAAAEAAYQAMSAR